MNPIQVINKRFSEWGGKTQVAKPEDYYDCKPRGTYCSTWTFVTREFHQWRNLPWWRRWLARRPHKVDFQIVRLVRNPHSDEFFQEAKAIADICDDLSIPYPEGITAAILVETTRGAK